MKTVCIIFLISQCSNTEILDTAVSRNDAIARCISFATGEFVIVRKEFGMRANATVVRSVVLRDMLNKASSARSLGDTLRARRDGRGSNINVNATVLYAN